MDPMTKNLELFRDSLQKTLDEVDDALTLGNISSARCRRVTEELDTSSTLWRDFLLGVKGLEKNPRPLQMCSCCHRPLPEWQSPAREP